MCLGVEDEDNEGLLFILTFARPLLAFEPMMTAQLSIRANREFETRTKDAQLHRIAVGILYIIHPMCIESRDIEAKLDYCLRPDRRVGEDRPCLRSTGESMSARSIIVLVQDLSKTSR